MSETKKTQEPQTIEEMFSSPTPAPSEQPVASTSPAGDRIPELETASEVSGQAEEREADQSTALVPLPYKPIELKDPDHGNLSGQISRTIHIRVGDTEEDTERALYGALKLYTGLNPQDTIGSILARLTVAHTNNAMEAAAREASAANVGWAAERYSRISKQNTTMVLKLIEIIERRRGLQ